MKIGISALLYNLKEALEICKEENIAHSPHSYLGVL